MLLREVCNSGSVERPKGSGTPLYENNDTVNDLVPSTESAPKIHQSTCQIARHNDIHQCISHRQSESFVET